MEKCTNPLALLFSASLLLFCQPLIAGEGEGDITDCSAVAKQVREAVAHDPSKVLLIVEDAVVTNETCVCFIIRAAIESSNADADLTRQILLTATNIAPQMSAVIEACVGSPAPQGDSGKQVVSLYSGKETESVYSGKQTQMVYSGKQYASPIAAAPVDPPAGDYVSAPNGFRGVYLLSPSSGGVTIEKDGPDKPDCQCAVSPSVAKRTID